MVLYKYAGNSGIKILEDLRLKITPPNEFNDPFEITPRSLFTRTLPSMLQEVQENPESYRPLYEAMHRDGAFAGSFDTFIAGLPTALPHYFDEFKKLTRQKFAKIDIRTLDTVSQGMGILCLSRPPNSIPMWSYYANHHRGVAFGFDVAKIGGRILGPRGFVKYRKERATVDPHISPGCDAWREQVIKTFFTKSRAWKHEQEYRRVFRLADLISTGTGKNRVYFLDLTGDAIREIILGCRISPQFEKRICRELQRRRRTFGHVQLYRCIKHPSKFELKVVDVNRLMRQQMCVELNL